MNHFERDSISNTNFEKETGFDIAVIGMAGRFPGAGSITEFWNNLSHGVESITFYQNDELLKAGVSAESLRNPRYIKAAPTLSDAEMFDAPLFGISPKEAEMMDPQSRVFLECAWAALEDAGYDPKGMETRVGVYATGSMNTYLLQHVSPGMNRNDFILGQGNLQAVLGNGADFLATRVSYKLNLRGPSLDVQCACSSSLTAVHLARQSLLAGECDMALAGGVSIYLPQKAGYFYEEGLILSPDGHCRAFDAEAGGTLFGRGAGIVVLKPLAAALKDGDSVYAVIKGSAINNDGSLKAGFTAPSVSGQAEVISEALADADVHAESIGYVEAHGTGTFQGDPIEIAALTQAYRGWTKKNGYCGIGTVKSNIGHLDAAAGVTGFIKSCLMLRHKAFVPTLHYKKSNPQIDFDNSPFYVCTEKRPWERGVFPRRAGVSAFGMGGTNAHVILEEAPERISALPEKERTAHLICLSAQSEAQVHESARRYADCLKTTTETIGNIAYTSSAGRGHFDHRLAVVCESADQGRAVLMDYLAGRQPEDVMARDPRRGDASSCVFLFSGQGAQYAQMGRVLYETQPVFRDVMVNCQDILRPVLDIPLLNAIYPKEGPPTLLDETEYTQPAMFSIEMALCELWKSWGIVPAAVLGHSAGEYAAACAAGVMSLEDGLHLMAMRGRLIQSLPKNGEMAAIFASEECVREAIAAHGDSLAIATINGPGHFVISGRGKNLQQVLKKLDLQGVCYQRLTVSHAFHSPLMEPVLDAYEQLASQYTYRVPRIQWICNLSGCAASVTQAVTPDYWRRHLREPVRFSESIQGLWQEGRRTFLEIGPHSTLLGMARKCVNEEEGLWISSLKKGKDGWRALLESAGRLYVHGASLNWPAVDWGFDHQRVSLPTYSFERKRYWLEPLPEKRNEPKCVSNSPTPHPLLGVRLLSPAVKNFVWESRIHRQSLPYLPEHRIGGRNLFPATAYLEMVRSAAGQLWNQPNVILEDISYRDALIVEDDDIRLQLVIAPLENEISSFQFYSIRQSTILKGQGALEDQWVLHAEGKIQLQTASMVPQTENWNTKECAINVLSGREVYDRLQEHGFEYGPCFQGIRKVSLYESHVRGEIALPKELKEEWKDYYYHPAYVDACLQLTLVSNLNTETKDFELPVAIGRVQTYRPLTERMASHVQFRNDANHPDLRIADVCIVDSAGECIADVTGIVLKKVRQNRCMKPAASDLHDCLYEIQWKSAPKAGVGIFNLDENEKLDPTEISQQIEPSIPMLNERYGMEGYGELLVEMDRLCAGYVVEAMRQMGWVFGTHHSIPFHLLADQLGVVPAHRRLFRRLLDILREEGWVSLEGDRWAFGPEPERMDPEAFYQELVERHPASCDQLLITRKCGVRLADVLRGDCNPLQLLFPDGSLEAVEKLYVHSPFAKVNNTLAKEALRAAVERMPPSRRLRILEIGAGTGGTTQCLLPVLPADRVEYTFTDVSNLFLVKAQEKYSTFPFMKYSLFDVEKDPQTQGFVLHSFDIIVAANVLHATGDLLNTFRNVRNLLASQGLLIMLEITRPLRWIDMTFGMTEGWWKFQDRSLRPHYPLLSQARWIHFLEEMEFSNAISIPAAVEGEAGHWQTVIAAQGPKIDAGMRLSKTPTHDRETWIVFVDRGGVGEKTAARLQCLGYRCLTVQSGTQLRRIEEDRWEIEAGCREHYESILKEFDTSDAALLRGILHFWNIDLLSSDDVTVEALADEQAIGCQSALFCLQALTQTTMASRAGFWIVTRGAQAVDRREGIVHSGQATVWGLGKVIDLEHPEVCCIRMDLDPQSHEDEIGYILHEIEQRDEEKQIAFRGNERYAARIAPLSLWERKAHEESEGKPYRLELATSGLLDSLRLKAIERRRPGPGEVEIEVKTWGLNFKDVLIALGMLPEDIRTMGQECAGVIASVGAGVEEYKPGDRVFAMTSGCYQSHITAPVECVFKKPDELSWEQAASISVNYLTAYYGLHHLAHLQHGERVLIHAAAGGVGLAAVSLAKRAGAEVYATAGSAEKRAFLHSLGVRHVMNSRTLDFAEELMHETQGEGVHVVLNSLGGEFIAKSMSVLGENGRFVELGRVEIWNPEQVAAFGSDISYYAFNLGEEAKKYPAQIRSMMLTVLQALKEGTLQTLPSKAYSIENASEAFRFLAQAQHIGKIVLIPTETPVDKNINEPIPFNADASYLITGGLGGLGLLICRWMIGKGARTIVLMGRSRPNGKAQREIQEMEKLGACIWVRQGDVSCEQDVREILDEMNSQLPPLKGVIHSAGTLDDGVLMQQDWPRFLHVMKAKVFGAWNLHRLTLGQELDFFLLFSSIASLMGSPGQGNHASANAFMDSLAHSRRCQGLPALSLNWGAWAEIGAAAGEDLSQRIATRGLGTISPEAGLCILDELMNSPCAQAGVLPIDWSRYLRLYPAAAPPAFFEHVAPQTQPTTADRSSPSPEERWDIRVIQNAPIGQRHKRLMALAANLVQKSLGLSSNQIIDPARPLNQLGLDSLMAVELRNRLGAALHLQRALPATLLFDYPTIESLTVYLEERVLNWNSKPDACQIHTNILEEKKEITNVAQLSDEEAEAMLIRELTSMRKAN